MAQYTRTEISATTGFDLGDQFESESQVREYFTVANMADMGLGGEPMVGQDVLNAMAETVIEHGWHMANVAA